MRQQSLQQVARSAFSNQDWDLLIQDEAAQASFSDLASVEDVERFVFEAYDRLRLLRPANMQAHPTSDLCQTA